MYIGHIEDNSIAQHDGRLAVGNRVLGINGQDLNDATVQTAEQVMDGSVYDVVFHVLPKDEGFDAYAAAANAFQTLRHPQDHEEPTDEGMEGAQNVELRRENMDVSFGFTLGMSPTSEVIVARYCCVCVVGGWQFVCVQVCVCV